MKYLLFIFLVIPTPTFSQVESSAYQLTLKTLLAHSVPEISVQETSTLPTALYLDARSSDEYKVSKIANAIYVGYTDFSLARVKHINKDQFIIVYCSVGYRSEKISEQLLEAGFTKVSNLYGGIFEWVNQGKPLVNTSGIQTDTVHAYNKTWGIWLNKGNKVYKIPTPE